MSFSESVELEALSSLFEPMESEVLAALLLLELVPLVPLALDPCAPVVESGDVVELLSRSLLLEELLSCEEDGLVPCELVELLSWELDGLDGLWSELLVELAGAPLESDSSALVSLPAAPPMPCASRSGQLFCARPGAD